MLLNEFFDSALQQTAEQRYDNAEDQSLMKPETTRKSRLTLREINKLRRMKELKTVETKLQNEFIASMYSQPEQAPGL